MPSTLVIGAATGIGFEFAHQLLEKGHNVLVTAKETSHLRELEKMGARGIELNLDSDDSLNSFCDRFDAPDLTTVIHSADPIETTSKQNEVPSRDLFGKNMSTHVYAPMRLIPQLAPMIAATAGRYVFISSDTAKMSTEACGVALAFRTSIAALNMLIRCAAVEYPQVCFLSLSSGLMPSETTKVEEHISVEQSVGKILKLLQRTTRTTNVQFFDYVRHRPQ